MNMFPRIYKFHFFCRKILPLVYDDSLSYYEFLCKLNQKIEEVIDTVNEHSGAIEEIMNELENVITEDRLVQTGGTSETDVMSQKAVTQAIDEARGSLGVNVVQETGQSTSYVMSQKAVTDALETLGDYIPDIEQTSGQSTENVMSQKAVTDAIENAVNTNWAEPIEMEGKTFIGKDTITAGERVLDCHEFMGQNGSDYDQITWDGSDLTYHLSNGGSRVAYNKVTGWNNEYPEVKNIEFYTCTLTRYDYEWLKTIFTETTSEA